MRSGYFHVVKRIQLCTDLGEHPLKTNSLELGAVSLNEVLKLCNTGLVCYCRLLDNQYQCWRGDGRETRFLRLWKKRQTHRKFDYNSFSDLMAHYPVQAPPVSPPS